MNVDQLRLNIEQLPPAAQDLSYYEKWSVSMLNHLRRSPEVIDPAAYRRFVDLSASSPAAASEGGKPLFRPGDRVIVREQGRHERMALLYYGCTGCAKKFLQGIVRKVLSRCNKKDFSAPLCPLLVPSFVHSDAHTDGFETHKGN